MDALQRPRKRLLPRSYKPRLRYAYRRRDRGLVAQRPALRIHRTLPSPRRFRIRLDPKRGVGGSARWRRWYDVPYVSRRDGHQFTGE